MSPKNDFKAFSISNNANVLSQQLYEGSSELPTGFPPYAVTTHILNKVLRQSSIISSVVADFISTQSGEDILDDGNIAKLTLQLNKALEQKFITGVPNASLTQKGIVQLTNVVGDSDTLVVTQKLAQEIINLLRQDINGRVPNIRKVNGKALSADISLNAVDVGAYTRAEVDSHINTKGNKNTASKDINGWWKCGDTGVIYQWGVVLGGDEYLVQFPISFPNRCTSVVATTDGRMKSQSPISDRCFVEVSNITSASFTATTVGALNTDYRPRAVHWMAIGY
ncbi:gp53-like domain-containing protein [Photorhabdus khanii]|uniref:gp53-like domain-containing protein n=1 Tax=Photorhabdus khanii TaxID=1004150 RepID=UPI00104C1118|nr:tail fiber protein [Photorhabdus khanii]